MLDEKLNKPLSYPQTPESAKAYFRERGLTCSAWAKEMKVSRDTVVALLRGKLKGNYGEAHKAAVLLGLKKASVNLNET